jgi:hypothetical protein
MEVCGETIIFHLYMENGKLLADKPFNFEHQALSKIL